MIKSLILAGGKGERIGGRKYLKPFLGKPLICWVFEKAKLFSNPVYISVRDEEQQGEITWILQKNLDTEAFYFIKDIFKEIEGPISGILSSLLEIDSEAFLIFAVDQPLVETDFISKLIELNEVFCNGFVILSQGKEKIRPFPGIYPSWLKGELSFLIESPHSYSLFRLFQLLQAKNLVLTIRDDSVSPLNFVNINTEEDLKKAEELCSYLK